MFGKLRDPQGGYSLLASGIALLVLAGWGILPALGTAWIALPIVVAISGAGCLVAWWRRRRADPYDLRRLFDEPYREEEPYEDTVPQGEASAPYCGWCDECFPPGTHRCRRCGRELG